ICWNAFATAGAVEAVGVDLAAFGAGMLALGFWLTELSSIYIAGELVITIRRALSIVFEVCAICRIVPGARCGPQPGRVLRAMSSVSRMPAPMHRLTPVSFEPVNVPLSMCGVFVAVVSATCAPFLRWLTISAISLSVGAAVVPSIEQKCGIT